MKSYRESPEGIAATRRYETSQKRKASRKRYNHSPKGMGYGVKYRQGQRGKTIRLTAQIKYQKSPKGKETGKIAHAKYQKSLKGKMANMRHHSKRRGLGTPKTIYGKPFLGGHLHHMSKDVGIYIPDWLHNSIWHCLETGYNMGKINVAAMKWYKSIKCQSSEVVLNNMDVFHSLPTMT